MSNTNENNENNDSNNENIDDFNIIEYNFSMTDFMTEEEIAVQAVALLGMDNEAIGGDDASSGVWTTVATPYNEAEDPLIGMVVAGRDERVPINYDNIRMMECWYLIGYESGFPVWTFY